MQYRSFAVASFAATMAMSIGTPRGVAQLASTQESGPRPRTLSVVITPAVFDDLAQLADSLQIETVRCLIGVERGDSLIIDLAWAPEIEEYSRHHVRYQRCPLATLALWHNHVVPQGTASGDMCYLSGTDIGEAVQDDAPPLQVVQVSAEVMCWWTQNQVVQSRQALKLDALPSQLFGVAARQLRQCDRGEDELREPQAEQCRDRTISREAGRQSGKGGRGSRGRG